MTELENVWMDKRPDGRKELRLDWSNDRHHAVVVQHPGGVKEIAVALEMMARLISRDQMLRP